jgi:hypothetical protein
MVFDAILWIYINLFFLIQLGFEFVGSLTWHIYLEVTRYQYHKSSLHLMKLYQFKIIL